MNRESGGAILAVAGFVFLVGAFKGTWRDALHGLAPDVFAGAGDSSTSGPARNGGDFGPTTVKPGSRLPGSSVAPHTVTHTKVVAGP